MPKKNTAPQEHHSRTTEMACLMITASHVFLLKEPVGKTCAIARVMLNEQLQMTGIRIVNGANGLFVAYPNDPGYKGDDYRSLYYPVTKELRDHIETTLLDQYQEEVRIRQK